jgi:Zn-dependent protease with chaperone function
VMWFLASVVLAGIALPGYLRLERVEPAVAIAICLSVMLIRALSAVLAVLIVLFYLPGTELYTTITQWCWHAVMPVAPDHLSVSGHELGDLATPLPLVALIGSAISMIAGLAIAAHRLRRWLDRQSLGEGPCGSTIVPGAELMLAAAGLARSQVVVSTGALAALDDAELAAGIEHERGHIVRRHRLVLLISAICTSLARFMPGTRRSADRLAFHVERDADAYALARRHDRLALAGAICKAALATGQNSAALSLQGQGAVGARLRLLLDTPPITRSRNRRAARGAAAALVSLVLVLSASVSIAVADGTQSLSRTPGSPSCRS